jgi:hypothetical protein
VLRKRAEKADAPSMSHGDAEVRVSREASFARLVAAFMRKDYDAMSPHVTMELLGSSRLAGWYQTHEEVSQYLVRIGSVLRPSGHQMRYAHEGRWMLVTHDVIIGDDVEVTLVLRIKFDAEDRVCEILVQPSDQESFDAALESELMRVDSAQAS